MIAETSTKIAYLGDGETKAFPFTFKYDDVTHIKALIHDMTTGVETAITSDYYIDTTAGVYYYPGYAPGQEAAEADQPAVLTENQKLVIYRETPVTQLIDLGEKYPLPVLERMSDKLCLIEQEHAELIARAIKTTIGSTVSPDELMEELNESVQAAVEAGETATEKAEAAADSATEAASSATAADTSATAAAASATAAAGSATTAAAKVTECQGIVDDAIEDITEEALAEARAYGLPVGAIISWPANVAAPAGCFDCDGASLLRTEYADLFAVIGTTYGAADDTHFNLPNFNNGTFLEGASTAGTAHSAGLPNIEGTVTFNDLNKQSTSSGALKCTKVGDYKYTLYSGAAMDAEGKLTLDASRSSAIYGNSTTVQPKSTTVRFIIKAYDNAVYDEATIAISEIAAEQANKADRNLANLTDAGKDSFLSRDFCIIYPNGGSEASPANVTINSRYVMPNPFSGYEVYCVAEVYYNGVWGETGIFNYSNGSSEESGGVKAILYNDSIVVQTGTRRLLYCSAMALNPFNSSNTSFSDYPASAPCRVKVWKIGKVV